MRMPKTLVFLLFAVAIVTLPTGCRSPTQERVVLYCSQDREYAESILTDFTKKTGIQVETRFDTEADKSVSLYEALVREARQPRCDVFWCNEPVLMQRLDLQGTLEPYASPSAADYPAWTRPASQAWQAFAARARILIVNKKLLEADTPKTLRELTDAKWRGRFAMAKPFYGTTATHAACLWQKLGAKEAGDLLTKLAATATVLPGNRDVAVAVAEGHVDVGLTDSDDALGVLAKGLPVRIVYLDQPQPGTLFLPNTLALIKDAPHSAAGKKLIDFLLSPDVEARLAAGPSGQIPLNPRVKVDTLRVATPATIKPMEVDYKAVAEQWEETQKFLRSTFQK
jgi:iron(III) transport system substrate-binding protein